MQLLRNTFVMNSLRRNISVSYAAVGILVVGLALLSFLELRELEEKIVAGERIGEFFGLALEIRRFEKNYFLYRQESDLGENRSYLDQARILLRQNARDFVALDSTEGVANLGRNLEQYAALMEEYVRTPGPHELVEARIRKTGKEIVTVAESLSRAERRKLQALVDKHRQMLIVSVVSVAALVALIGQLLSRRVSRPLQRLEESMAAVAAGRISKLDMPAQDREIVSLTRAFNHMLRELDVRQGQLVRSERLAALGTLLSGVAHELNNPLSNISSSCEILAEELGEGAAPFHRELLEQIDGETWRARRIVRSLLDYARDREFHKEDLPLARLLEDTLRLVKGRIPPQVTVLRQIADDLVLSGDKQRLQQVFFNLIGNAVEALGGEGELVIAARRLDAQAASDPRPGLVFGKHVCSEEAVEIEIRDNGPGIPADILPRIFDPFFTTKEVGLGLGLGLFIVFEIVEEHGGCIAVASEVGKGTAFLVRLPVGES